MKVRVPIFSLVFIIFLSACGGTSSSSDPVSSPPSSTNPSLTPSPTPQTPLPTAVPIASPSPTDAPQAEPMTAITVDADGEGEGQSAYDIIRSKLGEGSITSPDLYDGDHQSVQHIYEESDDTVGDYFMLSIHLDDDLDRGMDNERQRNEFRWDNPLENTEGVFEEKIFEYQWKVKIDTDFSVSRRFTHFFTLDPVNGDDAKPILTITGVKRGETDQLQVRHSSFSEPDIDNILASGDLAEFVGEWLDVTVRVKFADAGDGGRADIKIVRVSDDAALIDVSEENIDMWRGPATDTQLAQPEEEQRPFVRPLWGIYRSLGDAGNLRAVEERVGFANIAIRELSEFPPQATAEPTPTPTVLPTPQPSPEPTAVPTPMPTSEPTPIPTAAPVPTAAPSPEPTAAPTPIPTSEPTPIPTAAPLPTAQPSPVVTPTPTAEPTPQPTATPMATPQPTATATPTATPIPTATPTTTPMPTATPTAGPPPGIFLGGTYRINNRETGMALSTEVTSIQEGANVAVRPFIDASWQNWQIDPVEEGMSNYTFTAQHSSKALSIEGDAEGTNVVQKQFVGEDTSQWRLEPSSDGYFYIVSLASGDVLAEDIGTRNVVQSERQNLSSQQWSLELVSDGPVVVSGDLYMLYNHFSDRTLGVSNGDTADGTNVVTLFDTDEDWERWILRRLSPNIYSVIALHSGKALTISENGQGVNVVQQPYNDEAFAQWRLEQNDNGFAVLISVANGKVLTETVSHNVQVRQRRNTADEEWFLLPVLDLPGIPTFP